MKIKITRIPEVFIKEEEHNLEEGLRIDLGSNSQAKGLSGYIYKNNIKIGSFKGLYKYENETILEDIRFEDQINQGKGYGTKALEFLINKTRDWNSDYFKLEQVLITEINGKLTGNVDKFKKIGDKLMQTNTITGYKIKKDGLTHMLYFLK